MRIATIALIALFGLVSYSEATKIGLRGDDDEKKKAETTDEQV